eukprot:168611-Rhodomonas_salina.1
MTMSSVLTLGASMRNTSDTVPRITSGDTHKALAAMGDTISSDYVYFLDSGCSFTILKPSTLVYDIHDIPPR